MFTALLKGKLPSLGAGGGAERHWAKYRLEHQLPGQLRVQPIDLTPELPLFAR